ncbi:hypothetical protein OIU85_010549 [Salix viminalis]|uniref:Uncharacterized protein n=1 Tax=Salix viminalis TaxID=40686 RepID=A0A9Q0NWS5_SALVM|nr:hypothetical protein OIU85_010549 [Salix viminalis]
MFSTGFPLQEFKPSTQNFSLEGFESGYSNIQGVHDHQSRSGARLLFPIEDLKQQVPSNSSGFERNTRGQGDSTALGYWNGMLGGESWSQLSGLINTILELEILPSIKAIFKKQSRI